MTGSCNDNRAAAMTLSSGALPPGNYTDYDRRFSWLCWGVLYEAAMSGYVGWKTCLSAMWGVRPRLLIGLVLTLPRWVGAHLYLTHLMFVDPPS